MSEIEPPYMRTLATILLFAVCPAHGQEYKPFPEARITPAQWQQYFSEVSEKHPSARRNVPAQHLVVFDAFPTTYAFTTEGHAAHPAWITRRFIEGPGGSWSVEQIGYFAGREEPFARLFQAYQELNAQMRDENERRALEQKK